MHTKCSVLLTYVLLPLLFMLLCTKAKSQYRSYNENYYETNTLVEFGMGTGAMNCLTDLGGNAGVGKKFLKDVNLKNTQACNSIYLGVTYKNVVGLRVEATLGTIKAYDSILKPVAASTFGRYDRNLSFRSNISEIMLIGEFHPLALLDYYDKNFPHCSPYLLAGIGSFSFNPQAYFKGSWIDLHPLHLEGQGFKEYPNRPEYALNALCYPVGCGIRYEINNFFVARFEFVYRFTNTDYLDDVSQEDYVKPALFSHYLNAKDAYLASQLYDRHKELNPNYVPSSGQIRGHPNNNDAYFSIELKLGLTLGRPLIK